MDRVTPDVLLIKSKKVSDGFLSVPNSTEFLYKTTAYDAPKRKRGIGRNTTDLSIQWSTTIKS